MSYYPTNFYSNYPNNYQQQQYQYQQPIQQMPAVMQNNLNGRMVESLDVAKIAEVPLGGYGIFPKADLSEIYVKSWNNNGTTSTVTFKPIVEAEVVKEEDKMFYSNEMNKEILDKINLLEKKINQLIPNGEKQEIIRKEKNVNAY